MIIYVTEWEIRYGVQQDCGRCPVVLAIQRAARYPLILTNARGTVVHAWQDSDCRGLLWSRVLPPEARRFIHFFDDCFDLNKMKPFSFELDIPKFDPNGFVFPRTLAS